MPQHDSVSDLCSATERLLPVVAAAAESAEAEGRLTEPVLRALRDQGLFRLFVPRDLAGEEADLITALRVFELVSSADGAAGWTVMIGSGAGLFAGFMERSAAEEIFLDDNAVIAGSGAPTGVARCVDGGYRVSGRWAYASGAHHATWFTANCVVEDGSTDGGAGNPPPIRSVAVPADEVRVLQTWSVSGLRATGSNDIEIADSFVPFSRTFSVLDAPRSPGPLYRFPFFSIAELSFASVSLGIARHAIDAFSALAVRKRPMGAERTLAEDPDVRHRLARAEAAVASARAYLLDVAERSWRTVVSGDPVSEPERARIRLASVDAVQRCAGAVDLLYARAGMAPLFTGSALGRAWRDAHAVTQNIVVSAGLYGDCGRVLLDGARSRRPSGA